MQIILPTNGQHTGPIYVPRRQQSKGVLFFFWNFLSQLRLVHKVNRRYSFKNHIFHKILYLPVHVLFRFLFFGTLETKCTHHMWLGSLVVSYPVSDPECSSSSLTGRTFFVDWNLNEKFLFCLTVVISNKGQSTLSKVGPNSFGNFLICHFWQVVSNKGLLGRNQTKLVISDFLMLGDSTDFFTF